MNNFFFNKINLKYEDILEKEGYVDIQEKGKKRMKLWYEVYSFDSEEEYQEYKTSCLKLIEKSMSKEEALLEFLWFDLLHGIPQRYLFRTVQPQLILEDSDY